MSREAILLLGGTGFIGGALACRLRQQARPVHVLDRHNIDQLATVLPQCGTVVHLASATTPGMSARHPELELTNLTLTLHLADLLQTLPPTHVLFFSSGGTVYGNAAMFPVTEQSPLAPLSNYGAGKAAQEVLFQVLTTLGHAVTVIRPSNAYGPGQNMRHGFGLIRTLLEHALAGSTLEVWGDGDSVRDYIYIDDVVEATLRLIDLTNDSGTYNLGSGVGHSINQVKAVVERICGVTVKAAYRPSRGMDVRRIVLDTTRLQARLGWQPQVTLEQGIHTTWLNLTRS